MNTIAISFIVYTVGILIIGLYSSRFSKNTSSDFFLADRSLGAWLAALSSAASSESGWVTLGLVGTAFTTGIGALWIVPGTVAAFLFNWLILANRLRRFSSEHNAITLPDVLAASYSGIAPVMIRLLSVIVIVSMLSAYVAAQFNAAGKAFIATFEWPYASGVLVGAFIVLIYTIGGGFRAVVWTDVAQAILMVCAVVILPAVLILHLGGFSEMWSALEAIPDAPGLTHPLAQNTGMALIGFMAVWLGVPLGYCGQPHVLTRFMAARDEHTIRKGSMIATGWVFILFTGAVLLGIAARAVYGVLDDPEQALPIAAIEFLPGIFAGLMIAAIFAAICSTADSQLLVSASAVSHDIYVKLFGRQASDSSRTWLNRGAVLLIGIIALAVSLAEVRAVFDFVLYAWAGLGAAFGPPLILKLLWKRTTAWGVLGGMISGFTSAILWREYYSDVLYELVPAFFISLSSVVLISMLTAEKDTAKAT